MRSILQDKKECWVCRTTNNLACHHIFYGTANRQKSEKWGLKLWLCYNCHTGPNGVHFKGKKEKNIYIAPGARVITPTLEDVKSYCKENNLVVNPEEFFKAYAPDWMKGDEPIRDWQGLLRGWNRKAVKDKPVSKNRFRNFDEREHGDDYYDNLEQALLRK